MPPASRRRFLAFLAALPGFGSLRAAAAEPEEAPFPFKDRLHPLRPGEGVFPPAVPPSFLHPNGRWVVLPTPSGGLELWDWTTGRPLRALEGEHPGDGLPGACANDAQIPGCFSGDGRTWLHAATWHGGDSGQALLGSPLDGGRAWRMEDAPAFLQADPQRGLVHAVGAYSDGSHQPIYRIDTRLGQRREEGRLPEALASHLFEGSPALSADGRWILLWHGNPGPGPRRPEGWWAVWGLADGACKAFRAQARFSSSETGPAFSADGAVAHLPGEGPWAWSGAVSPAPPIPDPIRAGAFGPNEVPADGGRVRLRREGYGILEVRSRPDDQLLRRLVAFPPNPGLLAFGPEFGIALVAPPGGVPWLWNWRAPKRPRPSVMNDSPLLRPAYTPLLAEGARALAWSPDGARAAVGTDGGAVHLCDASTWRRPNGTPEDEGSLLADHAMLRGLTAPVRALAFVPGGLVGLALDGTVALWRDERPTPARRWAVDPHRALSLCPVPGGRALLVGSLDGAALWSLEDGRRIRRLGEAHSGAAGVDVDAAGERAAVAYLDGHLALFELTSGRCLWETRAHEGVAASVRFEARTGRLLSLDGEGRLLRWDPATGAGEAMDQSGSPGSTLHVTRDGARLGLGGSHPLILRASMTGEPASLDFQWDAECT